MSTSAVARELTAVLASTRSLAGDPSTGWRPLLDVAADHQLLPALWSALRRDGMPPLPAALATDARSPLGLLSRRYTDNQRRVEDLRAQLDRILDSLEVAGVDAVPLKGAHWLTAGLLEDPAAREMIDLDVLVPRSLAPDARTALERIGFATVAPPPGAEPSDHQLDAMAASGRLGSVELHVEPMVEHRRALLTAEELRSDATTFVDGQGMERRLPDPTSAATVLIGHAQLQEDGARLLHAPLRALHDLHELGTAYRATVDWDSVTRRFHGLGPGGRTALAGFAVAAREYFSIVVPVPTSGGRSWFAAMEASLDHPGPAGVYRQAAYLPRALRAERMGRLHGADHGLGLWGARLVHVGAGVRRRVRPGGR